MFQELPAPHEVSYGEIDMMDHLLALSATEEWASNKRPSAATGSYTLAMQHVEGSFALKERIPRITSSRLATTYFPRKVVENTKQIAI